jgi:3-isopropylmalate dehydrogenase
LLLRYSLDLENAAQDIESAVDAVIERGVLTRDLGGTASTEEVTAAVIDMLGTGQCRVAA